MSRDPAQIRRNLIVRAGADGARAAGGAGWRGGAGADRDRQPGGARQSQTPRSPPTSGGAADAARPRHRRRSCAACRAAARRGARACRSASMPPPPPFQWFPGLSQTGKLGAGAREVYRHALQHILLPRLLVRLEGQMRAHFEQPAFLYEATRVYLMLGSAGPLDRDLVKEWMTLDWQSQWPGPAAKTAARQPGAPPRRTARPAAGEGAARRRADRGRAPHLQPRDPGGTRLQHQSRARSRGERPCRPGGRPTPPVRRACACSSAAPARRSPTASPASSPSTASTRCCCPTCLRRPSRWPAKAGCSARQAQIDPASPQVLTLQRDVIALYTADYAKQWDALLRRPGRGADAQPRSRRCRTCTSCLRRSRRCATCWPASRGNSR